MLINALTILALSPRNVKSDGSLMWTFSLKHWSWWITSQVLVLAKLCIWLWIHWLSSLQSINHAIDFKMAYYKLAHCLEFNGKIALSPSYLIYTWIICFFVIYIWVICITCSMFSYIILVLIASALATQASASLFPHPPFQSWIFWPPPPFLSSPILYPGQYHHWQQLFCACSVLRTALFIWRNTNQRFFKELQYENKAQNRQPHVYHCE